MKMVRLQFATTFIAIFLSRSDALAFHAAELSTTRGLIRSRHPCMGPSFRRPRRTSTHTFHPPQNDCSLHSTTASGSESSLSNDSFDPTAVLKYGIAIAVQMGLAATILRILDLIVARYNIHVPFAVNFVFFYAMALKSRVLNPMSNTRPQVKTLEAPGQKDVAAVFKRQMPKWTPPGFIFPIVWLLIIGPIRATASSLVYQSVGAYASLPILSLYLHLSIGDVWNTINNIERRFGVAVPGVILVWLSKAHAAYQYGRVHVGAGRLVAATLIWLTIASALVTATWRLNPDPATGKPEPLYPVKGKAETKFAWFSSKK
jgi:translocator protein